MMDHATYFRKWCTKSARERNRINKEITTTPQEVETGKSNCFICLDLLVNPGDINNLFDMAEESNRANSIVFKDEPCSIVLDKIGGVLNRDVSAEEILTAVREKIEDLENIEEEPTRSYGNEKLWAAVKDLERAYYHLKNARDTLPQIVCLQAVKLRCGHADVGVDCITRWVSGELDEITKMWSAGSTNCPYCKEPLPRTTLDQIIDFVAEARKMYGIVSEIGGRLGQSSRLPLDWQTIRFICSDESRYGNILPSM